MLRDGMHQTAVHAGAAPYRPNSLDGGCPFKAGADLGAFADVPEAQPSPALSQLGGTWPLAGRVVGIVADGSSDLEAVREARKALDHAGIVPLVIAPSGGTLGGEADGGIPVQRTYLTARSTEFDASSWQDPVRRRTTPNRGWTRRPGNPAPHLTHASCCCCRRRSATPRPSGHGDLAQPVWTRRAFRMVRRAWCSATAPGRWFRRSRNCWPRTGRGSVSRQRQPDGSKAPDSRS